jgi:molybdopterin/thiamine biosynthesis adenylyltransferase
VSTLSDSEHERYAAQIAEIGVEAQERLKRARVIVIGAGATGAAAAAHLASCGVGYVGVVDGGKVGLGDLAGQAIYYSPDVGQGKADTLAGKLGLLNPEVHTESYPVHVDSQNAAAIAAGHDLVLDCTSTGEATDVLAAAGVHPLRPGSRDGVALAAEAIHVLVAQPVEAVR